MGHRNPDRVSIQQRYARGRTVADMAREHWEVISVCRTCGLMMLADLKLIAYVKGPNVSLWNRRARCRRLLCGGVVEFHAKAPGMPGHDRLVIDDRLPDPTAEPRWLKNVRRQD